VDTLVQDLRYALRQLFRKPAFTVVAVLTLALGIGANTAMFTLVNSVLLRDLPYAEPDRVVAVWNAFAGQERVPLSAPELIDYREGIGSLEELAAYRSTEVNLTGTSEPERLPAGRVTANLFGALGVQPVIGRTFLAEEDVSGRDGVAVLGHDLWQRRFGADPAILESTIIIDGHPRAVVGVMPPSFRLPSDYGADVATQLWVPLALDLDDPGGRGLHNLRAVARLAPDAGLEAVNAELGMLTAHWVAEGIEPIEDFTAFALPIRDEVVGDVRPALLILFGAVGLVLLITCANVANLLLTRADERRKELVVRAALGAGRGRIARQLLVESLVLAGVGAVAGVAVGHGALQGLLALEPAALPRLDGVAMNGTVLGFTACLSVVAGLLFGLGPAMRSARSSVVSPLGMAGGGEWHAGTRLQRLLVVGQVALAVVVVIGAGLLARSFGELRSVPLGFDPEGVLTASVTLPTADYPGPAEMVAFYRELVERAAELPEVRAAGATARLPLAQPAGDWGIDIEGRPRAPGEQVNGYLQVVTPGYFESMRVDLVRGRLPDPADRIDTAPSVVVNERFAERHWPGEDPIGQRIRIRWEGDNPWFTVVGVVRDVRHNALGEPPRHEMYFPHAQLALALGGTTGAMTLIVRTGSDPLAVAGAVREAVRSIDPNLAISRIRTMREVVNEALVEPRFSTVLLTAFGMIALLLGTVGVYGVISYAVSRRTREIGIRMALGARIEDVLGLVLRQSLGLTLAGVVLGIIAAFALTRLLAGLLYGVSANDPLTFVAIPVLVALVALLAAYVPARRAARVPPVVALRSE
jgi:putative ABC transport system permease protein